MVGRRRSAREWGIVEGEGVCRRDERGVYWRVIREDE